MNHDNYLMRGTEVYQYLIKVPLYLRMKRKLRLVYNNTGIRLGCDKGVNSPDRVNYSVARVGDRMPASDAL